MPVRQPEYDTSESYRASAGLRKVRSWINHLAHSVLLQGNSLSLDVAHILLAVHDTMEWTQYEVVLSESKQENGIVKIRVAPVIFNREKVIVVHLPRPTTPSRSAWQVTHLEPLPAISRDELLEAQASDLWCQDQICRMEYDRRWSLSNEGFLMFSSTPGTSEPRWVV
jgi:hypothetical protein